MQYGEAAAFLTAGKEAGTLAEGNNRPRGMSLKVNEDVRAQVPRGGAEEGGDPDLDLVREAREGSTKAYEELVARHQRRAFNVAYRILGDYDEALDLTQDAFLQAYRALPGFRGESRFTRWLLTITVNLCRNKIKYWRRRARSRTVSLDDPIRCDDSEIRRDPPDPSPSVLDSLSGRQTEEIIREEMMALDEEFRTVLVLRELQDMSYEEIGEIMGLAAGTVKSRLHRGRSMLRDRLRERLSCMPGEKGSAGAGSP